MEQIVRGKEMSRGYWDVGIYSIPEASRLSGVSQGRLRRWLTGYTWRKADETSSTAALWRRQLPEIEGSLALGFLDLIEARLIDAFREAGVPWSEIKSAGTKACALLGVDHPFATHRFATDGRRIFVEILSTQGEAKLLELSKSQYAFDKIVRPSFIRNIDFEGSAVRWWWMGRKHSVVIDPTRQFGAPIDASSGVPTRVLYDSYIAEESVTRVADLYEVEARTVRDAIDFEERLAA